MILPHCLEPARMKSLLLLTALLADNAAARLPEGDVVARRDRELNALIVRDDATAARAYYDDAFVLTTSSGKMKSKDDLVREIAAPGLVLDTNETTDIVVRVRAGTAVLTGVLHQRGTYDGKAFDVRLRVTDTWVRTDGQWRILAGHASVLPPAP
jgi:ketosteroid isomerase-like protein